MTTIGKKTVLITGSSTGIGKATADYFVSKTLVPPLCLRPFPCARNAKPALPSKRTGPAEWRCESIPKSSASAPSPAPWDGQ